MSLERREPWGWEVMRLVQGPTFTVVQHLVWGQQVQWGGGNWCCFPFLGKSGHPYLVGSLNLPPLSLSACYLDKKMAWDSPSAGFRTPFRFVLLKVWIPVLNILSVSWRKGHGQPVVSTLDVGLGGEGEEKMAHTLSLLYTSTDERCVVKRSDPPPMYRHLGSFPNQDSLSNGE